MVLRENGFFTFIIYNLVFVLLQFIFILTYSNSFIHTLTLPYSTYIVILAHALLQLSGYIIVSLFQCLCLAGLKEYISSKNWIHRWEFIIYFLTIVFILSLNCYFYPLSKFSSLFLPELPLSFLKGCLILSGSVLFLLLINAIKKRYWILVIISFVFLGHFASRAMNHSTLFPTFPNLIIIGVDSLSPDKINSQLTPTMDKFLKQGTHFGEVISPLARTYPAWTTILTGLYPVHHKARENLYPKQSVKSKSSFAWNFQDLGYTTFFATDDRRFNNLDEDFGFQSVIGPPASINEIILGTFNDFPLSNLLINTSLGRWLLPYNYGNRAGYFSYYPSTFIEYLTASIDSLPRNKPLFIAVHLTLPHWPYTWAQSAAANIKNEYSLFVREKLYLDAVKQADQQVAQLLNYLHEKNISNSGLVILLSDHGEALYKSGARKTALKTYQGEGLPRFKDYLKRKTNTSLEKSVGHGSDLLSPDQNHCVLGFQVMQNNQLVQVAQHINRRVALLDIAPTIADFFHFQLNTPADGISLLPTLLHAQLPPQHRTFLLESGMFPNQNFSKEKIIASAYTYFHVNKKNHRLELRGEQLQSLQGMKLYGLLKDDWLLALYPDDAQYIPILLHLSDQFWIDNLDSEFAKNAHVDILWQKLLHFYHDDLAPKLYYDKFLLS